MIIISDSEEVPWGKNDRKVILKAAEIFKYKDDCVPFV